MKNTLLAIAFIVTLAACGNSTTQETPKVDSVKVVADTTSAKKTVDTTGVVSPKTVK